MIALNIDYVRPGAGPKEKWVVERLLELSEEQDPYQIVHQELSAERDKFNKVNGFISDPEIYERRLAQLKGNTKSPLPAQLADFELAGHALNALGGCEYGTAYWEKGVFKRKFQGLKTGKDQASAAVRLQRVTGAPLGLLGTYGEEPAVATGREVIDFNWRR